MFSVTIIIESQTVLKRQIKSIYLIVKINHTNV